jgi:hypothetical protein
MTKKPEESLSNYLLNDEDYQQLEVNYRSLVKPFAREERIDYLETPEESKAFIISYEELISYRELIEETEDYIKDLRTNYGRPTEFTLRLLARMKRNKVPFSKRVHTICSWLELGEERPSAINLEAYHKGLGSGNFDLFVNNCYPSLNLPLRDYKNSKIRFWGVNYHSTSKDKLKENIIKKFGSLQSNPYSQRLGESIMPFSSLCSIIEQMIFKRTMNKRVYEDLGEIIKEINYIIENEGEA